MIFILFVDIYVEKDIVLMKRCRVILFYEMGLNFEFFVMYRSFKNLILVICILIDKMEVIFFYIYINR